MLKFLIEKLNTKTITYGPSSTLNIDLDGLEINYSLANYELKHLDVKERNKMDIKMNHMYPVISW